jgi:HPt (histidine-containing phosphotransfer) domain-containing protein
MPWLFLSFLFAIHASWLSAGQIDDGRIDLSDHRWSDQERLPLNGVWHFLPYVFISEEAMRSGEWRQHRTAQLKIPGRLRQAKSDRNQEFHKKTWGSLVLELDGLDQAEKELGLRLKANSAYSVYWMDSSAGEAWQAVIQVGIPGSSPEASVPHIDDYVGRIKVSGTGPYYLVIHISGFHYTHASIWSVPTLGPFHTMSRQLQLQSFVEIIAFGMILIMCIYNFSLFIRHPGNRPALYLSFLTLLYALRMVGTTPSLGPFLFPTPGILLHEIFRKFEFSFLMLIGICSVMFAMESLGYWKLRLFSYVNLVISVLIAVYCWIFPVEFYQPFLPVVNSLVLFYIALTLGLSIHSAWKDRGEAILILWGVAILAVTAVYDMAVGHSFIRSSIFLSPFGFTFFIYFQGQVIARQFAQAFKTAQNLSENLKHEVEMQTKEVKTMLDSIPQGVMSIVPPGVADAMYSKQLEEILENTRISGQGLSALLLDRSDLSLDEKDRIKNAIDAVLGENVLSFELNRPQLPEEITLRLPDGQKIVQVTWNPVVDKSEQVVKALITLHDVTQARSLQREAEERRQELRYIQEVMAIPAERFSRFMHSAHEFMEQSFSLLHDSHGKLDHVAKTLLINFHTIKGEARSLGLKELADTMHGLEDHFSDLREFDEKLFDKLTAEKKIRIAKDVIGKYDAVSRGILERHGHHDGLTLDREFLLSILQVFSTIVDGAGQTSDQKIVQMRQKLQNMVYASSTKLQSDISRDVKEMARSLAKEEPIVEVIGDEVLYPDNTRQLIQNFLTHLLRNSLDHGIEDKLERFDKGKGARGRITIDFKDCDSYVLIAYSDDGRGLALDKLRAKARKSGLINDVASESLSHLAELIFHSGLSTADQLTMYSGRGVGMEAVRKYIEESGGSIEICLKQGHAHEPYRPFEFHIKLPRQLFVRAIKIDRGTGESLAS